MHIDSFPCIHGAFYSCKYKPKLTQDWIIIYYIWCIYDARNNVTEDILKIWKLPLPKHWNLQSLLQMTHYQTQQQTDLKHQWKTTECMKSAALQCLIQHLINRKAHFTLFIFHYFLICCYEFCPQWVVPCHKLYLHLRRHWPRYHREQKGHWMLRCPSKHKQTHQTFL